MVKMEACQGSEEAYIYIYIVPSIYDQNGDLHI